MTPRVVIRAVLAAAALAGFVGCAPEGDALGPVPLRLIGRWENTSRSHAGRHVMIAPDTIRFGQGGSLGETHAIEGARERILGGGVIEYDLACVNTHGQPYVLTLVCDTRRGRESMWFKNRTSVHWTKRALT